MVDICNCGFCDLHGHFVFKQLFMMGDFEPKCSEFIPSALVWLLGPCPWLLPGNIASSYTTRGAQPLHYHANFQTDLITTISRSQTQWGRPPPRRVFEETKHKTPKQRLSLHQSLNSFPHRKTKRQSSLFDMQHALCCVALVSALPSWQWRRKTKNKFSSIHTQTVVHFHWGEFTCVNSPQTFQNHLKLLTNSKNILLLHDVVVKISCVVFQLNWNKLRYSWLITV